MAGAILVITDASGHSVTSVTTGADGRWSASIPAGTYTITPQLVQGLLGTAKAVEVSVTAESVPNAIQITYDTGIQ